MGLHILILIVLSAVSAISGSFIKLGVRLVTHKKAPFLNCFVISFVSLLMTLFISDLSNSNQSKSFFVGVLPAITFFLSCWLLNTQFINYSEQGESEDYRKAFLATVVQGVGLFASVIFLSIGLTILSLILMAGK